MQSLQKRNRQAWEVNVLSKLARSGRDGEKAVHYIALQKRKAVIRRPNTPAPLGAPRGMTIGPKEIQINQKQEKSTKEAMDPWTLSLIAHEGKHYEQGLARALSVFGELEAWAAANQNITRPGCAHQK